MFSVRNSFQLIPEVAKTAGHLTVFQRTPNWCAPLHNGPIDAATQREIRAGYPEIFARCRDSHGGFIHEADPMIPTCSKS